MDTKDFERLHQRIETAKQERDQATGGLKSLEEKWQETYGFSDKGLVEKKLAELRAQYEENEETITATAAKLEELTAWEPL